MIFFGFSDRQLSTPCLSKKHLNFGQDLEFLNFPHWNRGLNQQNRRHTEEHIRNNEENRRSFDKKFRDREPYFLLKLSYQRKTVYSPDQISGRNPR